MPFENSTFSRVAGVNVIYFWSDVPAMFSEVHRALTNGGKLILGYSDQSPDEVTTEVLEGRLRPPPTGTDVPEWLRSIVVRGLCREPDARRRSMEELLEELQQNHEEVRLRRQAARRRKLLVIGSTVLVLATPLSVWYGLRVKAA